jgi:hydroxymethylglutaryl-CoA lyase
VNSLDRPRLYIQEVSARDGFQMESQFIPTDRKIAYIDGLSRAGLAKIEVTSFSSPVAIPTLADAEAVIGGIVRASGVVYTALVPNLRGCERALATDIDEINLVMSASESHNLANLRMTREQSLAQMRSIAQLAVGSVGISASISTAFGCPFEGPIGVAPVLSLIERLADIGIDQISLCDTTGMANPAQAESIVTQARSRSPAVEFTAHFHNTRGMGLANALASVRAGVTRFDASLGGLGGCPFAPGATGNVCTEDLVHMFQAMGYETGVDLNKLLISASELPGIVGHEIPGQVVKAGPSTRRYPLPSIAQGPHTQVRPACSTDTQ